MKPTSFKVELKGEDYLRYISYQNKKQSKNRKMFLGIALIAVSICFLLLLIMIITYPEFNQPTKNYGYSVIKGFIIPNVLIYVMMVGIALGWAFHGFGFLVIKR